MSKSILLCCVSALALPSVAMAADPVFKRDRNIAVADRVPNDVQLQHWGAFLIAPTLTAGLTTTDNVYYSQSGKVSDVVANLSPSFGIVSDWGRHQVRALVNLDYDHYSKYSRESTLAGNISGGGRYDISQNTSVTGTLGFSRNYEPRYEPTTPQSADRPIRYDASAADLGFTTDFSRLRWMINSSYRNLNYADVRARNGGLIDQDYRDFHSLTLSTRIEYAVKPETSIFVDYEHVNATYRVKVNDHSSSGYNTTVGASFDLSNLATGEIAYGYLSRDYKNPLFKPVSGPSYRAKVNYFPTQITTISITASRSVEEAPAIDVSGYVLRTAGLSVDHEYSRDLVLSASYNNARYKFNGFDRDDTRSTLYLGARYLMTRAVSINGGYTHRSVDSRGSVAVPNYNENELNIAVTYAY